MTLSVQPAVALFDTARGEACAVAPVGVPDPTFFAPITKVQREAGGVRGVTVNDEGQMVDAAGTVGGVPVGAEIDQVTGGIENVTVGGISLGKLKVHMPPPQFSMPTMLAGLKSYQINGQFSSSIQPEDLIDTTGYTNTYYVDNVGGNDANSGLTWALRKKSVGNTMRAASASGLPSRVLVWNSGVPYYRQVSFMDDGVDRNSAVPILVEAMNGRVQVGPFDNLAWAKTGGATYTYQAARSNSYRCVNPAVKDDKGLYAEYTWVASSSAVDTTEGSWFTDGTTVYVHPHNHETPTLSNARVLLQSGNLNWSANNNLVIRGFDFEGGQQGPIRVSNGSTNIVVADDCTFRYSCASNLNTGGIQTVDGAQILGVGLFAAFNCSADRNSKDGFNLHAAGGIIPNGLFVNCRGTLNGLSPSVSNNGFTTHDGVKSISIGCDWRGNYGTGSGHVSDGTQVWSVGDVSGASMGDSIYGGSIPYGGFGVWSGAAEMWMDSCRDVGAEWGVIRTDTAIMHLRNHRGSGRRSAGITAF